jgi:hypothetical protein
MDKGLFRGDFLRRVLRSVGFPFFYLTRYVGICYTGDYWKYPVLGKGRGILLLFYVETINHLYLVLPNEPSAYNKTITHRGRNEIS